MLGYTLMISEKPDAMRRIAQALGENGSLKRVSGNNVEYCEFERDGKKHVIVCAVGHCLVWTPMTMVRVGRTQFFIMNGRQVLG